MSADTRDQFCSGIQILCEFTHSINVGSQTEAPALENIGLFLIEYSRLHALVKKALYRFSTSNLT